MNRLTTEAPHSLKIDGVAYPINTSTKNVLLTLEAFEAAYGGELADVEAWEIFLENIFTEPYPENLQEAYRIFEKFLKQCQEINDNEPSYIDFIQDNKLIYDAILSKGMTGQEIKSLHWWDLISHLSEVENTRFNRVVYLRMQRAKGKLTKEERAECDHIGWDTIAIKRTLSAEEAAENDYYENVMKKFGL